MRPRPTPAPSAAAARVRLLGLVALLATGTAAAQEPPDAAIPDSAVVEPTPALALLALPSARSVTLRWAPGTPALWRDGNRRGYRVDRIRLVEGTEPEVVSLTPEPLRPWSLEEWRARVPPDARYPAIAAQMLHGEVQVDARGFMGTMTALATAERQRHGFAVFSADMDSLAANGLALRFVDRDVVPGEEYLYRVYMGPDSTGAPPADTAFEAVLVEAAGPAPPPAGLRAAEADDRIGLTWQPAAATGVRFSAYAIERSDDGGRSWRALLDAPFVPAASPGNPEGRPLFVDSTAAGPHRYRVFGLTAFATRSEPAEVEARTRDRTAPPTPVLEVAEHVRESTVRLRWRQPEADDLRGFLIGLSTSPDGPFEAVRSDTLPASAREATDSRAVSGVRNYYAVIGVDGAGNASVSTPRYVHLVDSIPPARPTGVAATVDTAGVLTIRWRRGDEPDLLGYRIYRANQADHAPTLATRAPVPDTAWVDSIEIRSLTREVFLDVVALDINFNASPPTRVRVPLPDVVAPAPPVFTEVTPSDSGVALRWTGSPSGDVAEIVLERRAGGRPWQEQDRLGPDVRAHTDLAVEPGETYEYRLAAIDSAGLRSTPSETVRARPFPSATRPGVTGLEATVSDGVVRLGWTPPAAEGFRVLLYRAEGSGPLARYRSAGPDGYRDIAVRPGTTYRYAVQVLYDDGGRSRRGQAVTVAVPGG